MFKFTGSLMIITTTVFLFNKKTLKNYFTYKFLSDIAKIIRHLEYEKNKNLPYEILFKNLEFDYKREFERYRNNIFICGIEISKADDFFNNIGKRDRESEEKYLKDNYEYFNCKEKEYYRLFTEERKVHLLCGVSAGVFVVIFLL